MIIAQKLAEHDQDSRLTSQRLDAFSEPSATLSLFNAAPASEFFIQRNATPKSVFSLLDEMWVERGDISDWNLLHDLHYKAEKLPLGPRFWKLTLAGETIGVLVSGVPKGMVRERHIAMPNIRPSGADTKFTNTQRYVWINENIRVVSRFVLDTMYRGVGAGYRAMNLASRLEGKKFMEIQSSMSKFNMFGQKAGFRFVAPLNANKFEKGMKFFRQHFESNPQDSEELMLELESKPEIEQRRLTEALRDFYGSNSALENTGSMRSTGAGEKRVAAMDHRSLIKAIQQMCLSSPLYGVYINPDHGRKLPDRLPLSAFDRQGFNKPLVF
jgi:uncharacterized protein